MAAAALIVIAMLGTGLTLGLSSQGADAAPVADVVDNTVCYGFDEGTGNATEDQQFLHEVVLTAGNPPTAAKAQTPVLSDPAGNIESIALRNDAAEIYAYDFAQNQMYLVDADTGAQATPTDFALSGLGDIDAMFFQNDTDGDPTNDILWTLLDIDDAVAGNADADELRGYNTAGTVVAGPVALTLPTDATVEGATWLPDANGGTGEFFISYTITAAAAESTLASLGTGSTPSGSPTTIGTTQIDVEGLGTDGAGHLFMTTGEDGGDADNFYHVNEVGAVTTLLLDMSVGAPVGGDTDFESIDCAYTAISLTKDATEAPTRLANGNTSLSYTFTITNDGELPLENVQLTDPMAEFVAAGTVVSGPTPDDVNGTCSTAVANGTQTLNIDASCTAVWVYEVDVAPADYGNEASVTGTPPNGVGDPVTDTDTETVTVPVASAPDLNIIKSVAATAGDCPASFAAAAVNVGLDTIDVASGADVVYCINVINNGPGTATGVSVADNLDAASPRALGTITAAGEESYNYTVTVGANPEVNTAVVSGNDQDGNAAPTATDNAGTTEPVLAPDLDIIKSVAISAAGCPASFADAVANRGLDTIEVLGGSDVVYCINVINNGPGDASNVSVDDDLDAAAPRVQGSLASGAEASYNYVVTTTETSQTNVAVLSGEDSGGSAVPTATDNAGTTPAPPVLDIVKTVVAAAEACPASFVAGNGDFDTLAVATGSQVKYCISVINTGTGIAYDVVVTDDLDAASPRTLGEIAPGAELSYEYNVTVGANPETNVAVVAGNDGDDSAVATATDNAGTTEPVPDPSSISNLVFQDDNNNGIQDAGEPGVAGVTVNLLQGGAVVATTTTDANGEYNFPDLAAGTYQVQFEAPGRTFTTQDAGGDDAADSDANPADGTTANIVLPAGTDNTSVDAGLLPPPGPGSISNFVFEDTNSDGVQDVGETGIGGVTVNLRSNNNGVPGSVIATDTTDANGEYLFDNLAAGDYFVEFITPTGRTLSPQNQGGDDALDSDADPATGVTALITLPADTDDTSVDAGMSPLPLPGSISNLVFEDTNQDGVQDAGEPGVAGVTVNLRSNDNGAPGAIIGTDITDANGEYLFDNLAAGDYFVEFVAPNGRTITSQDVGGDDALDSDADPATRMTANINLDNGEDDSTIDVGLLPALQIATIGNFVWSDDNDNGVQDAGEPGIEGVTVNVWETDAAGNIPGGTVPTEVTTDANGEWTLDVDPGNYRINVIVPTGATGFTTRDAGGDDATDSDIIQSGAEFAFSPVYTVASGDTNLTIDAGVVFPAQPAELGDFVWEDQNNNGIQDAGEPGIENIVVQVLDGGGQVVGTATTDANGEYLVTDLPPGVYTVSFINTTGGTFTAQDAGGDAADSDADATGQTAPITLSAGESNRTVDAGIVLPSDLGSISNFVWEDTNEDGVQDPGEPGIAGIQVQVLSGGTLVGTDTTDANGEYLVDNLPAGTYTVQFNLPGGRTFTAQDQGGDDALDSDPDTATGTTGDIALGAGEDIVTVDAGVLPIPANGSISNFVWEDTNEDGVQDAGEPGVAGVIATLRNSVGAVVGTDTTDANGEYLFDNLAAGDYTVEFTLPTGRTFTAQDQGDDGLDSDANPADGVTAVITLAAGENNVNVDAGVVPIALLGSISNFVWEDTNEDGVQDAGEPGVAGVIATLRNSVGAVVGTDTTDANGEYLFDNLAAGDYTVEFTLPTGRTFTAQDQGDDGLDSDANPADGVTAVITLAAGENNVNVDAGVVPIALPGSISNFVWEDTNEDGVQDAGEPGVAGVIATLRNSVGAVVGTDTTDANGEYLFDNLAAGDYTVEFTLPTGRTFTAQDQGDDGLDSDANPADGVTAVITLAAGENNVNVDAGVVPIALPGSISNFVWEDTNEDGVQDAGEPGVAGVTVNLWSSVGGAPNAIVGTDTTDANGEYSFDNLAADNYFVQFVTSRDLTTQDAAADDATDSDANPADGFTTEIALLPSEDNVDVDAGVLPVPALGSISDFVFEDTNQDGIQDVGEPGVQGVTVTVRDAANAVVGTTMTDANGGYIVTGLAAGDYTVQFTLPTGREFTAQNAGGDDTLDSDVNPATGVTGTITLAAGQDDASVDAGVLPIVVPARGSISDMVFLDTNNNGIQDAGEGGVQNVVVTVRDGATVVGSDVTDGDGTYLVGNLPAGDYTVEFTLPGGLSFTTQNAGADEAIDSDANPATGVTGTITLAEGEDNTSVDAGVAVDVADPTGSISNVVFQDANANGVQDADETGVAGVTVRVLDSNGMVVGSDISDTDGSYLVSNLPAGDYTVEFLLPGNFGFTDQDQGGDDSLDSDVDPATGITAVITLAAGENNVDIDAGVVAVENPVIGLAKRVTAGPTLVGADISITYTFVIENLGNTSLSGITLADDFDATFAGATVESGPTLDGGTCSSEVAAAPGHTLAVGESCTAVWTVVVGDWVADRVYNNTATVTGTSPAGAAVSDVSDDGVDPDANSNGSPADAGEDTPTPVRMRTLTTNTDNIVVEYSGPFNNPPELKPEPVAPPAPPVPVLVHTGSNASLLATLAIALMGAGGALMIGARRKSDEA